jgi:hypothetical protein
MSLKSGSEKKTHTQKHEFQFISEYISDFFEYISVLSAPIDICKNQIL